MNARECGNSYHPAEASQRNDSPRERFIGPDLLEVGKEAVKQYSPPSNHKRGGIPALTTHEIRSPKKVVVYPENIDGRQAPVEANFKPMRRGPGRQASGFLNESLHASLNAPNRVFLFDISLARIWAILPRKFRIDQQDPNVGPLSPYRKISGVVLSKRFESEPIMSIFNRAF